MKLKKNEVLVIKSVYNDGCFQKEDEYSKEKYIFGSDAKGLRSNSRNLHYWDGNNWKHEEIKVVGIARYEKIESGHGEPAYSYWEKCKINDVEMTITTSNCSGYITPYWEEILEY